MKETLLILISVVALMVSCGLGEPGVGLGCLPSDRLVFHCNTTMRGAGVYPCSKVQTRREDKITLY